MSENSARVASKIDFSLADRNQKSGCVSAIGAVGQLRTVEGMRHLYRTKFGRERSTNIHADAILHAMVGTQPGGDLVDGQHLGTRTLGDRCRIGNVIKVTV